MSQMLNSISQNNLKGQKQGEGGTNSVARTPRESKILRTLRKRFRHDFLFGELRSLFAVL